jgi:predicted ATP-dependent serine protease
MNHINAPSIGQGVSGGSENLPAAQNGEQAAQPPSQYPSGDHAAKAAPAPAHAPPWLETLRQSQPLPPEAVQAQAETARANAVLEIQREATKQKELDVQIEEKRVEREKVRQRVQAQPKTVDPNKIKLEFAMSGDTETAKVTYLVDPFLPCKCVVGFFGRGGTAKSSFLATMAAMISHSASTLWISAEELTDWIKARHIKAGGVSGTLMVYRGIESDGASGQQIQIFGVYEHLDATINMANIAALNASRPPVRLVVLDTAVALTIWPSGQGSNDDSSVKRLLAYMQMLAEKHDVTIAFIGHNNKRSS